MPKKNNYSELNGVVLEVADFPNWKHFIMKCVARALFIEKVQHVIIINKLEAVDESTDLG